MSGPRHVFDLFPQTEGLVLDLGEVRFDRSNLDPYELFVLAAVTKVRRPRRIFEIGTYDGATTLQLARAAPEAEVLTLDLPPDSADQATVAAEVANQRAGRLGARFRGAPEAARITQLLGDSATFDFSPYAGSVDVVLVDGSHESPTVDCDTRNALALCAPGGVVVWDDYIGAWPDVVAAVDAQAPDAVRVHGTDFAVLDLSA